MVREGVAIMKVLAIGLRNLRIRYARVSTQDQDIAAQMAALQSASEVEQ